MTFGQSDTFGALHFVAFRFLYCGFNVITQKHYKVIIHDFHQLQFRIEGAMTFGQSDTFGALHFVAFRFLYCFKHDNYCMYGYWKVLRVQPFAKLLWNFL